MKRKQRLFRCTECGLHYLSKDQSDQCEAWCRSHQSCNLEITAKSVNRNINRVEYKRGLFTPPERPESLPATIWNASDLPDDIHQAIREERILDLEGVYGRKELGSPIEYDRLTFVLSDRNIQIEFYNRGITLFITDDERFRRIHRVLGKLDPARRADAGSAPEFGDRKMAKRFQFHDFKENDAWLVFRVDVQIKNESVDVYLLMDLPKGIILNQEISLGEGLSLSQAEEFLKKGKSKKGSFPKRLILAKGDPAESVLLQAIGALGMALDTVPASQLEELTAPLKEDFGKHFFSPSSIPYAGLQDDTTAEDRESAKKVIPDSYDPCWCASGKKFKFCCKPIFREIIGAMKAAEEGRMTEALEWIAGAKKIAGETAEILCREAIVYSYFDQKKSDEFLTRALQVNPNHPRAQYILGIHLKEKGDLKGAATAYEAAIAHYPSSDRFHLNEAYNNLGTAQYDMGNYAGAKSAWEQALIFLPSDRMVRQNLIEFIYENPIVPLPVREVSPFMKKFMERR